MMAPETAPSPQPASRRVTGRGASPGVAIGPVHVVTADGGGHATGGEPPPVDTDRPVDPEVLDAALDRAAEELRELADRVGVDIGSEAADILATQAAFADDPVLRRRIRQLAEDGLAARQAVTEGFGEFRSQLAASDDELLSARVADIDDVVARILRQLGGAREAIQPPDEPSVIVAVELTPSETAELPRAMIAAIVTERGSPTSHAAIISRAMGVPCVVGAAGAVSAADDARQAVVDGAEGEVVFDPDPEALAAAEQAAEDARRAAADLERFADVGGRTADGRKVEIAANIGGLADLDAARDAGAEGAGLVRTELLYLDRDEAPTVDEQHDFVVAALRALPGHRVVVRTLDIGADKPLGFVTDRREPNPALGVRGLRLSLAEPEVFVDQLTALLRAAETTEAERRHTPPAAGDLCIMLPMVTQRSEIAAARQILEGVQADHGLEAIPFELGIMVETPLAALGLDRMIDLCDFVSVGTNDLVQYLFAADRLNADVEVDADAAHPVVLDVIAGVVHMAHAADAWVGVCGEAAGDPMVARALIGLGVDELSMSPSTILATRAALADVSWQDCRTAVDRARRCGDAAAARELLAAIPTADRGR